LCKGKGIFRNFKILEIRKDKKVQQAGKPGSVIPWGISIIYLSGLPPGIGRATLDCRYTWPCNPCVCTATPVTRDAGELLPHLFTFTPRTAGLLFSVPERYPCGHLPFRKHGALCCPDFPIPLLAGSIEQPATLFIIYLTHEVCLYFPTNTRVAP